LSATSAAVALSAAGLVGAAHASFASSAPAASAGKPFDFNGDGNPDLAVGSPFGKVGTHAGAGFVSVIYGGPTGPNLNKKQVFSQDTAGIPDSAENSDHFGFSLTSADTNLDGFADLIVGAPDEDTSAGADAGTVTIILGGPTGLTSKGSTTKGAPFGAGPKTRYGYSMTTGDYNADSHPDWFVSTPGLAGGFVFSSATSAATATRVTAPSPLRLSLPGRALNTRAASTASTAGVDSIFVASANVDGHPGDDLIIGWQDSTPATPDGRSGFNVFNVSIGTPSGTGSFLLSGNVVTNVNSLAAGDFDHDGHADVAVGSTSNNRVTVFRGADTNPVTSSYKVSQETLGVPGATATGDAFGSSLAAGDVNDDGIDDLAIGVPGKKVGGHSKAGEAVVLYGAPASGSVTGGLTGNGSQAISQDTSGVPGAAEVGDLFGNAVSIFDRSNIKDTDDPEVLVGAPHENGTDGAVTVFKITTRVTGAGAVGIGAGTFGVTGKDAQLGGVIGRNR
jgi:hypothetical protein